ncbi:hypothetical protein RhiirA5_440343 [Rhizophagus irregularis]|uniref:Uncharacterized protein n=1 Tax=Rhizophagus irregularis TaxID=588596 RepID=A0A2N0NGV8_9GLOM|nr:hypothetical protein RhiirA5_440343 [Rhizophagus irregularis]
MPQNKKFHKEAGFIRKIDEIATEAELNQQLSEYGRRSVEKGKFKNFKILCY